MKKIVCSCLLLTILLILNSCGFINGKTKINITGNINRITINSQPGNDSSLKSTENEIQITEIINYINSLDLKKTFKDVGEYVGMSYIITIYFEDKSSTEYNHFGNMFFKKLGENWYEIPYNQAEKFEDIYNSIGTK